MSLFAWADAYSVHNPQIDSQHKELFRLADQLHDAMSKGAARTVIGATLKRLSDYTVTHFQWEETLMRNSRYPQLEAHRRMHNEFATRVLTLRKAFDEGRSSVTVETLEFLRNWLKNHILVVDRQVGEHLKPAGPCASGSSR
jgi:hemerythrin-like metal-binding protein